MTNPKVLVATCTYKGKHYAFSKWWKGIQNLNFKPTEILIVENSDDGGKYAHKLRRIVGNKAKIVSVPRLDNSRDTLSYSQNYIRKYMLDKNFDYWMSIESDVVPPTNAIEQLMVHGMPVVGGLYEIGFEGKCGRRFCVFVTRINKETGVNGTRLITQEEHNLFAKEKNKLVKVHGCGIGCTLIRRDIVKKYPFWTDERFTNKHSDVYFYKDLWNDSVPVHIDTGVVCEHYNSDWSLVADR